MATRIAIAQQKEAALARIAAAAARLAIEPAPTQGKQDADAYTVAILDWAAGTLDALAAAQPTATPAAPKRSKTSKADEGAE